MTGVVSNHAQLTIIHVFIINPNEIKVHSVSRLIFSQKSCFVFYFFFVLLVKVVYMQAPYVEFTLTNLILLDTFSVSSCLF